MVNPIKNQPLIFKEATTKKKAAKEVDLRVKKAIKKSNPSTLKKIDGPVHSYKKIAAKQASAEKAAYAARLLALETKKAAVKAQKAAFLAQRAHMAQQAAAARRVRAAEKARKAAEKAAKKAANWRRVAKIKAYLARPDEKKRSKLFKKYIPSSPKKKKNS